MSTPFTQEQIKGQPVPTYTKSFEGQIFGFTGLLEVEFGDQRFPYALQNSDGNDLYLGQFVRARGDSRGYVPGG